MAVIGSSVGDELGADFFREEDVPAPDFEAMHDARQRTFLAFYGKYAPKAYAYVRSRSFADETADDIVQKVFEIAWRRFDEVASHPAPDLWILRITENTCRYEQRKFWRRQEVLMASSADIDKMNVGDLEKARYLESPLERRAIENELYLALEKFVNKLPKKQKEVFQMRMNGITYEEIGYALRISAEAARRRMLRAIESGKQLFGEFVELLG